MKSKVCFHTFCHCLGLIVVCQNEKLELQATFAARDHENAAQALVTLQKQYDHLSSQQSHWDELRHASEQIEMLTTLFSHEDKEELRELRRVRDRSQVLEGEHAALQKRSRDQESKVRNSEQALLTARQGLASAQQRSSEWERRAKEYEGKLEMVQTQLDQSEQIQAQLDADCSLAKLQLEEKDADERLAKVSSYMLVVAIGGNLCAIFRTWRISYANRSHRLKDEFGIYTLKWNASKLFRSLPPIPPTGHL
jgi:hypothetical protein